MPQYYSYTERLRYITFGQHGMDLAALLEEVAAFIRGQPDSFNVQDIVIKKANYDDGRREWQAVVYWLEER